MPSGKKSVSCIPCAKRKVRCDKVQPCCHCKRRRQDTCVYPESSGSSIQLPRGYSERIEKLEQYIRILGGNPKHADEARSPNSPEDRIPNQTTGRPGPNPDDLTSASRSLVDESSPGGTAHPANSELVAHGDAVTYIET
jgi:hypothetical protein